MNLTKEQFNNLRAKGLTTQQIISFSKGYKPPIKEKTSLLDKAINVGKGASQFLVGSTSKTVGNLIGTGVESAKQLITGKGLGEGGKNVFTTEYGTSKILSEQSGGETATDIAFTALEIMPGGGQLTKYLRKLPGGNKVAEGIANAVKSVPSNLRESAIKQYSSIFRATSKESKGLTEKVATKLLDTNKVITSTEKLAEQTGSKLIGVGEEIGSTIDKLPKSAKIEVSGILKKLDKMKSKYIIDGKVVDNTKIKAIKDVEDTLSQFGNKIPVKNIIKIRQVLDESIDEAGGFIADKSTKFIAKVEKTAADSIRKEISKVSPELSKLNAEYSLLSNIKKLAEYTSKKAPTILRKTAATSFGGILGATQGEGLEGRLTSAAAGAFLGNKAIKYIQSPAWKSVSAITKNKIANSLAKGDIKTVAEIFRRLTTTIKNYEDK